MCRICLLFVAALFLFCLSAASAQQTPDNVVELKNQYSGKCLAVKGGNMKHGATLIHKECGTGSLDSIWEMRVENRNIYRIVNKNSGLCLGVEHKSTKDGAVVTQVSPCDRVDTLWRIEHLWMPDMPDDSFSPQWKIIVKNNNSNKCLALVRSDEIKQYGCPPHRPKTTWQFVKVLNLPATAYKRVFVTSNTYKADLLGQTGGDVSGADQICQNVAASANLPGTYRAWLSVYDHGKCEGMRMPDRGLSSNDGAAAVPYVNICKGSKVKVADSFSDLVDKSLKNPISCTENEVHFEGTPGVWTGTRTDGRTAHYDSCTKGDWKTKDLFVYSSGCYIRDCCWNYQAAARTIYMLNTERRCLGNLGEMRKLGALFCDGGIQNIIGTWKDQKCWRINITSEGTQITEPFDADKYLRGGYDRDDPRDNPDVIHGIEQYLQSLVGNAASKDKNWTQYRWLSCSSGNTFRLYCFEQ